MFKTFWLVTNIYFLGIGLPALLSILIDLIFGSNFYDFFFFTIQGLWLTSFFGIFSVALSIWDGQFISHIKDSHWSQRKD
jgi:hypothetical protein